MVTDKKFTKGIWSIGASWNLCVISESIGHVIAECSVESYMDEEEMRANAKLIAAAPELFEAITYYFHVLKEVRGENWDKSPDHVLSKMINAIKKATE